VGATAAFNRFHDGDTHTPFFEVASNRVKIPPAGSNLYYVRLCAGFSDAGIDEASHVFDEAIQMAGGVGWRVWCVNYFFSQLRRRAS
jgi:hypothetical protein